MECYGYHMLLVFLLVIFAEAIVDLMVGLL